jgi:hypothetical protein
MRKRQRFSYIAKIRLNYSDGFLLPILKATYSVTTGSGARAAIVSFQFLDHRLLLRALKPVPAGIKRPMMTFSLRPTKSVDCAGNRCFCEFARRVLEGDCREE